MRHLRCLALLACSSCGGNDREPLEVVIDSAFSRADHEQAVEAVNDWGEIASRPVIIVASGGWLIIPARIEGDWPGQTDASRRLIRIHHQLTGDGAVRETVKHEIGHVLGLKQTRTGFMAHGRAWSPEFTTDVQVECRLRKACE